MTEQKIERRFNVSQMAELFAVTERTIANWAGEGMPAVRIKGKTNTYPWRACFVWWLANKHEGFIRSKDGIQTKAESEAKLFQAKADREQMRLDQDRGLLVQADEIEAAWTQAATTVKNRVLGIPAALKQMIPALKKEQIAKIRKLCSGILEAIAECPKQPTD
jgi:phage terminase Nu1 subunit (DNA packaging protein)